MVEFAETRDNVKEYYGRVLKNKRDLNAESCCPDHRAVSRRSITLNDPGILAKVGMITFFSITQRAFKLSTLKDRCEDYGQVATYKGTC